MPELAEVYFHASRWKAATGQRFQLSHLTAKARCCRGFDAQLGKRLLSDAELIDGYTHGKRMLFAFSGGAYLEVHLGMTGSLLREDTGFKPTKHEHLVLTGPDCSLAFRDPRQFGKLALHESRGLPGWWTALPPEPHDKRFDFSRFGACCDRRGGSVVKAFLLMQEYFPGVGNWMADEILWRARVKPGRRVRSLSDAEREAIFKACQFVCREALQTIGKDYRDPPKSWLFSHRWRDGGTCPQTGEPLKREQIGGRTTCWSPAWQL